MLKKSPQTGFTLIEVLVVIVIVGILSALAIPSFFNLVRRSRVAEAEMALGVTARSLSVAAFDCGTYNLTLAQLEGGNPACFGPDATRGWMEQTWATLAPNYDPVVITPNLPSGDGARLTTIGSAGTAYAGITCERGVGSMVTSDTVCQL